VCFLQQEMCSYAEDCCGEEMSHRGFDPRFLRDQDRHEEGEEHEVTKDCQREIVYIPDLLGIVLNYDPTSVVSLINGLPVVTLLGVNDIPTGVKQITDTLGPQFQIVRGDTFFQMLRAPQL
jgi:hypothetical protein